ncbi:holin family protein, partial [Mameliella alba]|nr:holin family protein [Mameliella alba]MBY6172690.1 holin family protein [Mameliella alba]
MGMISQLFAALFGGGRNVVAETAEVFRVNAEAEARRGAGQDAAALAQMAAEFANRGQRGAFDRFMDGVNRVPRPAIVVGIVWLLVQTARDPAGMAQVFEAWAILPEAAWVIIGIVVTFYFGGRHQAKSLEFRRGLAGAAVAARALEAGATGDTEPLDPVAQDFEENPALRDWRA